MTFPRARRKLVVRDLVEYWENVFTDRSDKSD